jgi:NADH dehydrogenase/NADH:ubiquinone oxidoreductase subunit G
VQASYASAATEMADIILPVGIWSEQAGHYLNLEGRLQKAERLIEAPQGVWNNQAVLETISQYVGAPIRIDWMEMLHDRVSPTALQRY